MDKLIKVISALLEPDCREEILHDTHILTEKDRSASLNKVTILDLKQGTLLFRPDKGTRRPGKAGKTTNYMSSLLVKDGSSPHNRACDAVFIICEACVKSVYKCTVVYIEMKSGKDSAKKQFQSTKCFMEYLKALLKEFHEIEMDIKQSRYIVFSKKLSISKTSSRPQKDRDTSGSSPKTPKTIPVNNGDIIPIKFLLTVKGER